MGIVDFVVVEILKKVTFLYKSLLFMHRLARLLLHLFCKFKGELTSVSLDFNGMF